VAVTVGVGTGVDVRVEVAVGDGVDVAAGAAATFSGASSPPLSVIHRPPAASASPSTPSDDHPAACRPGVEKNAIRALRNCIPG
jgi:hypothetical protein